MNQSYRQIEGRNPVLEALRAGTEITKIYIELGIKVDERVGEILAICAKKHIAIEKKGWKNLHRMAMSKNCQGIIAFAQPIESHSLEHILKKNAEREKPGLVIVIPEALYEYNLGAIIRTCECAGADCVIINKRISLGVGVGRASMGAIEYVPIVTQNIHSSLAMLKEYGYKIFAAKAQVKKNYYDADLTGSIAIIIGSEDKGISITTDKYVDEYINIPMFGRINSLNMSVAGAVILYESVRQRLLKNCEKKA